MIQTVLFGPTEYVFNEAGIDKDFRVESDGNANMLFVDGGNDTVGIGTANALAVLTTDPEAGNFSSGYNNYDGVGLFIRGNGTSGDGNYGPALAFGSCNSDLVNQDQKHSAISIVQTGTDPNETGLAFWTHPSATAAHSLVEAVRIDSDGVLIVNNGSNSTGGIVNKYRAAITVGTSAVNISNPTTYGGLAFVWVNSSGNIAHDLVSYSLSAVDVVASQTISGSPVARTYSAASGILEVAMASGSYSVYATEIRSATG